ncbi:MAG: hypothetical protein IPK32_11715 [Verrucomicrobiaceae bacterium]|nr:hypothetical protein [Verrucomicrobiaceae bacterium]
MASTAMAQTTGTLYKVTRVGQDVLGGQTNDHAQCIMTMSPNGQYVAGVRFGATTRGFYMTTGTPVVTEIPKVTGSSPYALANDINDSGNSVGHEKWTSGANVNVIAWFHNRTAGTTVRLLTPFDANASITAIPTSMTSDSAYAFGSVDSDGPAGPTLAVGGYWNLSTRAWTAISGVREVLDASADGTKLLVIGTDGSGKILSGSVAGGWPTTVYSYTTPRSAGKVSPNGRYVGASQRISGVPTPFIYDTVAGTRTNLALVSPQDNLGGIIGAVSDTGRALGTIYTSGAAGSFAVLWTSPTAAYTRVSNLLVSDGHTALQPSLTSWNVYNGGDGMSADGLTWGVYGSGPLGFEDSLLWQQQCPAITVTPTTLADGTVGALYTATLNAAGGSGSYTWTAGGAGGGASSGGGDSDHREWCGRQCHCPCYRCQWLL